MTADTSDNLKSKVVKGVFWTLLETFTTKFASFFVTLVLARLLTPADYGTVALLTLAVNLSAVLIDSGFGQALVQKKNADETDFNSVFYLSIGVSVVVYTVLFFLAPAIASYYDRGELVELLRVLSLILVINAIGGVQNAELNRKMLFNRSFKISMARFAATSVTGISLALAGWGPWALVWSSIIGSAASVCASWHFIGWRPKPMFSLSRLGGLFSFGWKFSASAFLGVFYDNVYGMIIGKVYSPTDLAFVDKGRQVPQLALTSVNGALQRVSFPAMASIQDDLQRVRNAMRKMIQCSTFVIFPMMAGLAVCAKNIIPLFFGDQWGRSIPFMTVFCIDFLLYPFHTINLQTLSAIGRSDIFLKLEIVKRLLATVILICTYKLGVLGMICSAVAIGGPLCIIINAYPNQRILHYSIFMQVRDALAPLLYSLAMASVIYQAYRLPFPPFAILTLQIIVGSAVYVVIALTMRNQTMREYLGLAQGLLKRMRKRGP